MAVKRVFSAGGIVVKKTGGEIRVLVTQHSKHKGWDFPKGHRELSESDEQAALREVEEETGVVGEVIERVGQTQYFYWEAGEKIFKTVVFFLMKFVEQKEATTAFEVLALEWLKPEEVEGKLTFKDTKELWGRVVDRVKGLEIRD
jgi:8-oxo-dGTP pyrophosphatase MutT (NUDIX family)